MVYDAVKAHDYYIRNRKLKGLSTTLINPSKKEPLTKFKSTTIKRSHQSSTVDYQRAIARVGRLKAKTAKLQTALTEALQALASKRQTATKTEKENSDGKSTVKERQSSKEYRDKNQQKLKSERSKDSSEIAPKSVSSMSVDDLITRVDKLRSVLQLAKSQLSDAQQSLGALAHSNVETSGLLLSHMTLQPINQQKGFRQMTADFSGYATRNNLRCSDGRTILADAFKDNDGQYVPLVWQHDHDDPENVLGHVKLENRPDGVYCYAYFNESAKGQHAKEMVRHGDVKFLSIFANQLKENIRDRVKNLRDVIGGNIREVSLVLGGANPGAVIEERSITHNSDDDFFIDEGVITTGIQLELAHADTDTIEDDTETVQDVLDTLNDKQQKAVNYLLSQALTVESDADDDDSVKHGDTDSDEDADADADSDADASTSAPADEVVDEDADNSNDADSNAEADADADETADDADNDTDNEAGDAVQHDNNLQEDDSMTHNVFDQAKQGRTTARPQVTLSHDDVKGIVENAKKGGSLKAAVEDFVLQHGVLVEGSLQHGIENIDYLFPDAKLLETSPAFLSRRMEWVDNVLSKVRKSPFSRIKTISADITPDEARARGYIKGNMKNEEYFEMAKRTTSPQTVYKKQKLDRDDVIDIVDLDVVAWLKAEMKVMLDEELAGAILIGDGRSAGDDDKIIETNIRPIASDAELYVTTANVNIDDASSSIEELVDSVIAHRRYYKGSGQPTFYTTETVISAFLTVKDNFGRRIYSNIQEVSAVLRVSDVVPVEIMERVPDVIGIMVNLADYTLGADRGGQATMFDDFDIDYNKLRYLIECRVSGALTQPKAAVVFRKVAAASVLVVPLAPEVEDNVLTVPTVTGVVYKDAAGSTLTTGAPVTLTEETSPYLVKATPSAGKYFANDANDEWVFTYEV